MWDLPQELYSQHFILFVTYKLSHWACVFVPGKPFQPSVTQHSSLCDPLTSNKEDEVLRNWEYGLRGLILILNTWFSSLVTIGPNKLDC